MKEAGFPQEGLGKIGANYFYEDSGLPSTYNPENHISPLKNMVWYVYEPTLEEVIAALGEDLDCLINQVTSFRAASIGGINGYGATPLEACCNLWLAIHTKPQE